jgi:hypothetical protein
MNARGHRAIVAAAVVVALAAAAVIVLIVSSGKPGASIEPPSVAPAAKSPFPVPPRGSLVYAREDRTDVLAVAILPRDGGLLVRTSVIGQQGKGVRGLRVSLTARGESATRTGRASTCGPGCYETTLGLPSPPRALYVVVQRAGRTTSWSVTLPREWPARDATALIARAARVWKSLRSVSYVDRLSSGPRQTIVSHWRAVAPDRLAYRIAGGGSEAVIIGSQRWDRADGGAWVRSPALRVHQPQPFWVRAIDAHVVGSGRIGTRTVWRVSFFDPKTLAWFLASIDKATARTLDVRMWATAHFMHDTYGQFNAPLEIVPPA